MPRIPDLIALETKVRALLEAGEVPEPDRVEYGHQCVRLFWDAPKLVLVVDLHDDGERWDPPFEPDEAVA